MISVFYNHSWSSDKTEAQEMQENFGKLLYEADTAGSYEVESSHLFKKGRKYYWIDSNGCSCWDGDYEGWELNKPELMKLAKEKVANARDWREAAEDLVAKWVLDNL